MSCTVNSLIIQHYGPLASRRKRLALDAGVSIRTAENWLAGASDPQVGRLKVLAENNPAFRADLIAWLEDRS